jgi:hypothetical protein
MAPTPGSPDIESFRKAHRVLPLGLAFITSIWLVVTYLLHVPPSLPPGAPARVAAGVSTGISLTILGVALLVYRPRVASSLGRPPAAEYWSSEARGAALQFWVFLTGSGVIGLVGLRFSGSLGPLVGTGAALYFLLANGPTYFESAGHN